MVSKRHSKICIIHRSVVSLSCSESLEKEIAMQLEKVEIGLRVRTNERLGKTTSMLIVQKHGDARQPSKEGTVSGYVPGHGGDVWWVTHNDGTVGAYMFDEFSPV